MKTIELDPNSEIGRLISLRLKMVRSGNRDCFLSEEQFVSELAALAERQKREASIERGGDVDD